MSSGCLREPLVGLFRLLVDQVNQIDQTDQIDEADQKDQKDV
jgi:hypothetical protein